MFLSAERTAHANRTILSTFEQTSVAWQAIPHWDTCDPGQTRVRRDITFAFGTEPTPEEPTPPIGGGAVDIDLVETRFLVTLAQATSDTPDALLASVLGQAVELARRFDKAVLDSLGALHKEATGDEAEWTPDFPVPPATAEEAPGQYVDQLVAALIGGRTLLEDSGFRAGSCLVAGTTHFTALYRPVSGIVVAEDVLRAAGVNSVNRVSQLDNVGGANLSLLLGRRQEIAHRCGAQASPGEEGVDLAVSVAPSLEIVGDTADGCLELGLRLRYALRVKDPRSVVVFSSPVPS